MLLSAAKAESAQASSCNKAMRRSLSEHVVRTSGSPPNNRIRDQMMKEKLINEQMRTNGSISSLRTQSFILPRVLHVIPEQPEEEVVDPETYSYSDINVYF
ncbi:uncharacterized protein LOC121412295 [Lytechinus variegatus]|uniref:uncharacterized protein LOC121412295 n=1 Tax=Lytechinus variegatus TaxID=7654 RepID=UPI001BB16C6B|nr:uncharacterized protein LOC121412295 [Lytechinus variegatus]